MKQKIRPTDEFFFHPPWRLLILAVLFLVFGVSFLIRCSELGGEEMIRACKTALLIAGAGAIISIIPVLNSWGSSGYRMLIGVSIAAGIRLLISLGGVAVVLYFTSISPLWLIVFFASAYGLFLLIETAIAIRLLRTITWNQQDSQDDRTYEYVWYADRLQ